MTLSFIEMVFFVFHRLRVDYIEYQPHKDVKKKVKTRVPP